MLPFSMMPFARNSQPSKLPPAGGKGPGRCCPCPRVPASLFDKRWGKKVCGLLLLSQRWMFCRHLVLSKCRAVHLQIAVKNCLNGCQPGSSSSPGPICIKFHPVRAGLGASSRTLLTMITMKTRARLKMGETRSHRVRWGSSFGHRWEDAGGTLCQAQSMFVHLIRQRQQRCQQNGSQGLSGRGVAHSRHFS